MTAPTFMTIGDYTLNLNEVLHVKEATMTNLQGQDDLPALKVEFIRKGVIYLPGVTRKDFDTIIDTIRN